MKNYCQKCGSPNEAFANFCKKCGNSFGKVTSPILEPTDMYKPVKPKNDGNVIGPAQKNKKIDITKPKTKKGGAVLKIGDSMKDVGAASDDNDNINNNIDEDDEGGGISVDFVPDIDNLDFEIEPLQSIGVNLGELIEKAKRDKTNG